MAKIRNVTNDTLAVPALDPWGPGRLVAAGAEVEIPDDLLPSVELQVPVWEVTQGTVAHEAAVKAAATRKANAEKAAASADEPEPPHSTRRSRVHVPDSDADLGGGDEADGASTYTETVQIEAPQGATVTVERPVED